MHAYCFSLDAVTSFYSSLKRRKQNVRIMFFKFYYLGFLKVQYLGHFYSTYLLMIYLWVSKTDLLNFADDNTTSAAEKTIEKLISTLEQDSQLVDWFKINEMIVSSDKFQTIVIKKNCRMKDSNALKINNQIINSENCIKLLGIEICKHSLLTNIFLLYAKKQAIN